MFHMAYLVGSIISCQYVLDVSKEVNFDPENDPADPNDVLFQLNMAHILVPVFNLLSIICEKYGYNVLDKVFDTISIC